MSQILKDEDRVRTLIAARLKLNEQETLELMSKIYHVHSVVSFVNPRKSLFDTAMFMIP